MNLKLHVIIHRCFDRLTVLCKLWKGNQNSNLFYDTTTTAITKHDTHSSDLQNPTHLLSIKIK